MGRIDLPDKIRDEDTAPPRPPQDKLEIALEDARLTLRLEHPPSYAVRMAAALVDLAGEYTALEIELRRTLWQHHGCGFEAMYGDDGEMSCCRCFLDFKRMPLPELRSALLGVQAKRIADAMPKLQEILDNSKKPD